MADVVLTEQDFEEANVEATKQIDILDFVDLADIDPRYFERPYWLGPDGDEEPEARCEPLPVAGTCGGGGVLH